MKPGIGQNFEIKIDRLNINNGHGVGRVNNFVIFVPDAAPGDLLQIKITQIKKTFGFGEIQSILTASKFRITPPCEYYNECGGCQLQHVSYDEQVNQKFLILERFTSKYSENQEDIPFYKSPKEFNYRNRIKVHQFKDLIGFKKSKSDFVINIDSCLIAEDELNKKLAEIKTEKKPSKNINSFEIASQPDGTVEVRDKQNKVNFSTFSQVNSSVNKLLIEEVLKLCHSLDIDRIHDLYCGQGNFTGAVQKAFSTHQIMGVELSPVNIKIARQTHKDIDFVIQSAEKYLKKTALQERDLVIVDPPRTGCTGINFNDLIPAQNLIYISCNLATLERDTKLLLDTGYNLKSAKGFDMFPQTGHFEVLCHFSKKTDSV